MSGNPLAVSNSEKVGGRGWLTALVLIAACVLVILYYWNSLWAASVDLGLHYAVTARIMEYGHVPTIADPSLGSMNGYPSLSHTLAALSGQMLGSTIAGLQLTALIALAALWASIALMLLSLPGQQLRIAFGAEIAILLLNKFLIHLELFGNELLWNFFFPQLVSQAAGLLVITLVLYMERRQVAPEVRYAVLGASVPILAQLHPLPALEVWGLLVLQLALDFLRSRDGDRRASLIVGLGAVAASLLLTVLNPSFITVARVSENNGALNLRYTPNPISLVIESGIVIAGSAMLLLWWMKLGTSEGQRSSLMLKYSGLLGLTIAGLCLLQVILLTFGVGSVYAVKKYAYGLNTLLVIDLPLLLVMLRIRPSAQPENAPEGGLASGFRYAFPGLFVLASLFTIMPPTSTRVATIDGVIPVERFATKYRAANPGSQAGQYDYAAGLPGGNGAVDFMITIGVLKTPQGRNVDDFLQGRLPSRPRQVGRVFTSVGAARWDIPACRELVTPDGFAILDGACVMQHLLGPGS